MFSTPEIPPIPLYKGGGREEEKGMKKRENKSGSGDKRIKGRIKMKQRSEAKMNERGKYPNIISFYHFQTPAILK
ncbi:MAG: hypothetical protein NC907_04925 [Candidatus Omnitrophica bacterium]|nr:hypothetical protein [Candidatus Omnitrophota bacterium]